MSGYLIAREQYNVLDKFIGLLPVLDLPDAEHIHLHRRPDGTWSAVAMEESEGFEPFSTVDEATGERYVGLRAIEPLWIDAPADPEDGACD